MRRQVVHSATDPHTPRTGAGRPRQLPADEHRDTSISEEDLDHRKLYNMGDIAMDTQELERDRQQKYQRMRVTCNKLFSSEKSPPPDMVKQVGEKMDEGNGLVKLNIGGTWYTTTESTLNTYPEAIFPKMLAQRNNKRQTDDGNSKGYYFIDRDGALFRHILNFLRTKQLSLPKDFTDYEQLISEAEFYGLRTLANQLRVKRAKEVKGQKVNMIEVVETAHPEKIGVCSARIVVSDELRNQAPFNEVIEKMPSYYHEEYQGQFGRYWIRTNLTRLDWAERLTAVGWKFMGNTSICRRLPDVTGKGSDLCHIVEKWCLDKE